MANTLYDIARQLFLEGQLNWLTDDVKVLLIDTAEYAMSVEHSVLADIPALARVTSATTLVNKKTTAGAADADDATFASVSGPSIEAMVLYKSVPDDIDPLLENEAASTLLAYIDTATGLPIAPNGGDIIVTWDNGINKIFRL